MNTFLGEFEVSILDRKFTLRPSFEGLIEMESRSGNTISQLVNNFLQNKVGVKDLVSVLYGGIIGASDKNKDIPKFEEFGSMVLKNGLSGFITPCLKILTAGYSGKTIESEEKKVQIEECVQA